MKEKLSNAIDLLRNDESLKKINLTDPDAPIMKGKKGNFDTNYNAQVVCSEDQIISFCDVVTAGNDKAQLVPALKGAAINTGKLAEIVLADADYGTYDSFEFMDDKGICGYVPYKDMNSTFNLKPYHTSQFQYDVQSDIYKCPTGQLLKYTRTIYNKREAKNFRIYQTDACKQCPFQKDCCTKSDPRRKIRREVRQGLRDEMKERLNSEEGKKMYVRRMHPVEAIFGHLKHNLQYTQFLLRGIAKVKAEFTLMCLTHNLRKLANHLKIKHFWLVLCNIWLNIAYRQRFGTDILIWKNNIPKINNILYI